ncbi:MAG: SIS domain-containing protein [Patescibacteria group bacterium]
MSDFRKKILSFPNQLGEGFKIAENIKLAELVAGGFDNVILCGMGGSIIPAEILLDIVEDSGEANSMNKFFIHRDYELPFWASSKNLVICISWSGETSETISSYQAAKKIGTKTLVITTSGKLKEMAEKDGTPLILLPKDDGPPRTNIGYMFSALLTILTNWDKIDFSSKLEELTKLSQKLKPTGFEKRGQELAERIGTWTPLIYSSFKNGILASFWKTKFNENSKIHSFWNYFPNAAHNEIEGFGWNNFFAILLKDEKDNKFQQNKIATAEKFFENNGIPYETVELIGKTRIEKIFNDYILSDWASLYLAKNRRIDPFESEMIKKFKEMEE